MIFRLLQKLLLGAIALFAIVYVAAAIRLALDDRSAPLSSAARSPARTIAIFGASGTAGDGILKAALADPDLQRIEVITRRSTPRIEAGVASGQVRMTTHMDYLDYTAVLEQVADVDAVFWAIGTSSVGVDEETYAMIHVDFPMRFVEQWVGVSSNPDKSFHYISSSDISEDSSMMWAQQKVRAETSLFTFANGHPLKVVAYRPDYIAPTAEEAHLGQELLYWFFRPVGAAVKATQIGQAMLEVAGRGDEFENGERLVTREIIGLSDAYEVRGQ